LFEKQGLRVLMYHKFSETETDYLTTSAAQFDEQLAWLQAQKYNFVTMQDVLSSLEGQIKLPSKAILLTFDDAYASQLDIGAPILQKYGVSATIFVATSYLGNVSSWDIDQAAPILSAATLRTLDASIFSLALHTHRHASFGSLTTDEMEAEIKDNIAIFRKESIDFLPVFAYPFGARPKKKELQQAMFSILTTYGVKLAFRIGNRINGNQRAKNRFEMQRLDIRGNETMKHFKRKIKFGKIF
jgi:peptidoglycan/xylan/chitin deacetylase (PgdA/CDA1 family)